MCAVCCADCVVFIKCNAIITDDCAVRRAADALAHAPCHSVEPSPEVGTDDGQLEHRRRRQEVAQRHRPPLR